MDHRFVCKTNVCPHLHCTNSIFSSSDMGPDVQEKLQCKQIITSVGSELHTIPKLEVKQRVVPIDSRFESCVNWCKWGGLRETFQQPEEEVNPMRNLLQNLSVIWNVQINGSGFSDNDTWIKPIHLCWGAGGQGWKCWIGFKANLIFSVFWFRRASYWVLAKRTEGKGKFRQRFSLPLSSIVLQFTMKNSQKINKKNAHELQKEDKGYL